MTQNARAACGGKNQTHQKFQGRSFAGAIRAEETKNFTLVD